MKAAVIAALVIAASSSGLTRAQTSATEPPASAPGGPSVGPGKAAWATSFPEARRLAKEQGKVVFVEFAQKGCGNCFRMDGLLYPAVNFEMALLRMVPVKLDFSLAESKKLAGRYQIEDTPAILVVSPGGALIFRMLGFENDRSFYAHLHSSMADWDRLNLKLVHEPETIQNARSELQLGIELFQRFDSEEAIPRLERASSPKAPSAVRDEALAYLASAQMEREMFGDAESTIATLLRITKNPDRREKAELFRAQLALARGKREEARREFQSFVNRHPESKHRAEAKAYLDQMTAADSSNSK
ncbi:MAG: hypothetical protein ACRD16_00260 [Thermoanaerobaculia bacterium]